MRPVSFLTGSRVMVLASVVPVGMIFGATMMCVLVGVISDGDGDAGEEAAESDGEVSTVCEREVGEEVEEVEVEDEVLTGHGEGVVVKVEGVLVEVDRKGVL